MLNSRNNSERIVTPTASHACQQYSVDTYICIYLLFILKQMVKISVYRISFTKYLCIILFSLKIMTNVLYVYCENRI